MYHYEKALKASDIVWSVSISAVVWSSVLISVTWVELLWAVYTFFRINNIDLKCSFVWCRKYHKSWWDGVVELHISVDLLCGTRAAETFETWTFWKIQQKQIDNRPSANSWKKYVLRFTKIQQTFKRWTLYEDRIKDLSKRLTARESPRELVRQGEAKRKQAPQSEANVCRRRRQMQSRKTSLINCTGDPIMQPTQIRGCVLVPRTQLFSKPRSNMHCKNSCIV